MIASAAGLFIGLVVGLLYRRYKLDVPCYGNGFCFTFSVGPKATLPRDGLPRNMNRNFRRRGRRYEQMLRDEELELTDSTSGGDDNYDGDDFDGVQHGQNTGQEQTFHNPAFNNGAGNGNTVAAATATRGQPQLQQQQQQQQQQSVYKSNVQAQQEQHYQKLWQYRQQWQQQEGKRRLQQMHLEQQMRQEQQRLGNMLAHEGSNSQSNLGSSNGGDLQQQQQQHEEERIEPVHALNEYETASFEDTPPRPNRGGFAQTNAGEIVV